MISLNGRDYKLPSRPVVVVCIDGSDPEYFEEGLPRGLLPNLARFREKGFYTVAQSVMPSFTNPNNLSIITGAPPAVHGISGNFFLDPESGEEVMMNDPALLRCESLPALLSKQGTKVAIVTAKDKLRRLLGHGVDGICFSAELAHECTLPIHGIEQVNQWLGRETPEVYSAELSGFVMEAGLRLLKEKRADFIYLSLTDYVQHKHAPGSGAADEFYRMLDHYWGEFDRLGAVVGLTADHGMSAKSDKKGQPNIVYLQPLLDKWIGKGNSRVILPITDPYVLHHGALGSFASITLKPGVSRAGLLPKLGSIPGIRFVGNREQSCSRFQLPPDRVGDFTVVSDKTRVLGKTPEFHDLSQLKEPLRSHGGISESRVPFVLNLPLNPEYAGKRKTGLRNFDIFDYALNGP